MKTYSVTKKVAVVTGLLLGAFAISALADWLPPGSTPPTCPSGSPGCDAPINVGFGGQVKTGSLSLNAWANSDGSSQTTYGLIVNNKPILASGGLILPTCSTASSNCPDQVGTPATGQIWVVTP